MARDRIALSILGAGGLIGAGVFFGLRAGGPAAVAHAPPVPTTAASTPLPAPTTPPVLVLTAEAHAKATLEATRAVGAQREGWVTRCWRPALAKSPEPSTSRYLLALSFDKAGRMVVSGISQVRDKPSRTDVVGCLQSALAPFQITAPGAPVALEIPVEFP